MKQLALFLVTSGLSFQYFSTTHSFIWTKYDGDKIPRGEYFFEFREDGTIYYVINNNDLHTFIKMDDVGAVQEFIKAINNN